MAVARRRAQAEPLALWRVPKLDTVLFGVDAVMTRRARRAAQIEGLLAEAVYCEGRPRAVCAFTRCVCRRTREFQYARAGAGIADSDPDSSTTAIRM